MSQFGRWMIRAYASKGTVSQKNRRSQPVVLYQPGNKKLLLCCCCCWVFLDRSQQCNYRYSVKQE